MTLSSNAIAWLEARKLDPEIASAYGVESFMNRSGDEHIGFAYILNHDHVNTKRRSLTEKRFWMDEGGTLCLWNANCLNDLGLANTAPLIVTEGEADALVAIQCGFPNTVSIPNGAPAADAGEADKRYDWLAIHAEGLKAQREIILATDNDGPGHRLRRDLEMRLGRERCRWLRYPKGTKDLNDLLCSYGQDAVVTAITTAPWAKVDGLYQLDELPPEPEHDIMATGMPGMDRLWKIRVGEITVVSGPPNVGKTEWICNLACSMAAKHQMRVVLGSFEDQPRTTLVPRLAKWRMNQDEFFGMAPSRPEADQWIQDRFLFVVPDHTGDEQADIFWLIERLKVAVIRHEARLVIVDPWNEIEHDKPDFMPMTDYIGQALRSLKQFARNHDCHLVIVAHPSKGVIHKIDKNEPMSAYDIADSAHWVNKPDAILILHRDPETNITTVFARKIRFQPQIGRPGAAHMRLNSELGRFEAAPAPDELD